MRIFCAILTIGQIKKYIFRVGFENDFVAAFAAGDISGIAGIEMILSDIPTHNFLASRDFHPFLNRFSSFELRHNKFKFQIPNSKYQTKSQNSKCQ